MRTFLQLIFTRRFSYFDLPMLFFGSYLLKYGHWGWTFLFCIVWAVIAKAGEDSL